MQRPVMNPNFFEDAPATSLASRRRRFFRLIGSALWRACKLGASFLLYDPLHRIRGFRVEEGTPTSRFIRGFMYRLAFVPVLIAITACGIVWTATHPRSVGTELDPATQGVYYEAVTFLGADQTRLEGWLVPMLDAKLVLEEQDKVLRRKHPAVVLVHDFGQRREQMLPLVRPLHDAGYVVLALNLRGGGAAPLRGETFGLREAGDVRAAVDMLRRRPFVDPAKISIVGCGSGGTAAMLAANSDSMVNAVVAEHPINNTHELMQSRIMPQASMLAWLSPLCKWTFEISYGVDAEEMEMRNFRGLLASKPVLIVDSGSMHFDPSDEKTIIQIKTFLASPTMQAAVDSK